MQTLGHVENWKMSGIFLVKFPQIFNPVITLSLRWMAGCCQSQACLCNMLTDSSTDFILMVVAFVSPFVY